MELLVIKITMAFLSILISIIGFMMKQLYGKIDHSISRKAARTLIDDKLEPLKARHNAVDMRLARLELKIDRILEELIDEHRRNNKQ